MSDMCDDPATEMLALAGAEPPGAMPPITASLTRAEVLESIHIIHAAMVKADGHTVRCWGNPLYPTVARSAVKPFAALPLIETGAADALALRDEWISLACASHGGTSFHIDELKRWLAAVNLEVEQLVCGPRAPLSADAACELARAGTRPTPLHNDCSGEHLGFLSTALARGEAIEGYQAANHPVQKRILTEMAALVGVDPATMATLPDGCGAPTWAVPLRSLAVAAARFVLSACGVTPERVAARRILRCCAAHRELFGADDRLDTKALAALRHHEVALFKSGAEGVVIAAWPDPAGDAFGLALKVQDGTQRARDMAGATLLFRLGAAPRAHERELQQFLSQPSFDGLGREVGRLTITIPD